MKLVFLDANIFFAAVKSQTGGSYFIIELAKRNKLGIVTVVHALAEAEHNIGKKINATALQIHYENLLYSKLTTQSLIEIPKELEEKLMLCVPEKDIPILAGAILSKAEALITLDKKHFLDNEKLRDTNFNVIIATPGDFLKRYF